MDAVKAAQWEKDFAGKIIGNWCVGALIDNGKSAAVFEAFADDGQKFALKIFDDELIQRYGDRVQLARIERELQLVGVHHPNMVAVIGGGFDHESCNHYLVMEYLSGENLKRVLDKVPLDKVPTLISQLASAAQFLESRNLVHRDIKPENIVLLDDYSRLVLLDFGVIKVVGEAGLTDGDGIQQFVGTLQYSSPEFLLRNESHDMAGWRALTFYQIGGVMHDLIMRRRLFEESTIPYARLVNAVQNEVPVIEGPETLHRLIHVARCCLLKKPELRLGCLTWEDFSLEKLFPVEGVSAKQKVLDRLSFKRAQGLERREQRAETEADKNFFFGEAKDFISVGIRNIRADVLPPVSFLGNKKCSRCIVVKFAASSDFGLDDGLVFVVHILIRDAVERALTLSFEGFRDAIPGGIDCSGFEDFYDGVFDAGGVMSALEDALFKCVDKFQE
ncbi:serine/threonine protein kinase [Pseudomonas syringae]|uniref:serine/threonine protein kinase n=1 Tax=Pseudomonas syringae TaxID=317 RepID=UPI003F79B629